MESNEPSRIMNKRLKRLRRRSKKCVDADKLLLKYVLAYKPFLAPSRQKITIWELISEKISETGTKRNAKYCADRVRLMLKGFRGKKDNKPSASNDSNAKLTHYDQLLVAAETQEKEGLAMDDEQKKEIMAAMISADGSEGLSGSVEISDDKDSASLTLDDSEEEEETDQDEADVYPRTSSFANGLPGSVESSSLHSNEVNKTFPEDLTRDILKRSSIRNPDVSGSIGYRAAVPLTPMRHMAAQIRAHSQEHLQLLRQMYETEVKLEADREAFYHAIELRKLELEEKKVDIQRMEAENKRMELEIELTRLKNP